MSNLSEEEIIKQIKIVINLLMQERKEGIADIEQIRFLEALERFIRFI